MSRESDKGRIFSLSKATKRTDALIEGVMAPFYGKILFFFIFSYISCSFTDGIEWKDIVAPFNGGLILYKSSDS